MFEHGILVARKPSRVTGNIPCQRTMEDGEWSCPRDQCSNDIFLTLSSPVLSDFLFFFNTWFWLVGFDRWKYIFFFSVAHYKLWIMRIMNEFLWRPSCYTSKAALAQLSTGEWGFCSIDRMINHPVRQNEQFYLPPPFSLRNITRALFFTATSNGP